MSINEPFKIEGLQLRTRQKPINETVYQSKNFLIDYRITPKMFLGDDGNLYFQDNQNVEPIKLGEIEEAYDRIILAETGELRFYYDDFQKYVTLSQMANSNMPITKSNAVIYSRRNTYDPGNSFTALEYISSKYLEYAPRLEIPNDLFVDAEAVKTKFWDAFCDIKLRLTDETIFDTLVAKFIDGLRATGDTTIDAVVCTEDDCTLQNKKFFINNDKIGFKPVVGDPLGKIYYAGTNLTAFNNYCFTNLFNYNGIGKYLWKIFGPKVATSVETYYNWFYEDNGYTTISEVDSPTSILFSLSAANNASCDGISGVDGSSGPISLGSVNVGYVTFDVNNSTLSPASGHPINTAYPYIGCLDDAVIGTIETSLGRVAFDGSTTFEITGAIADLKIWYSDANDKDDNTGTADITYTYSPYFTNITGEFIVDALNNVAISGVEGISGINGFISDTENVFVGVFGPGTLQIDYSSGNIRPDSTSFYNTSVSLSGSTVGYVNTNLGKLEFGSMTQFGITGQTEVMAWYEDIDNSDGEGDVTFSYTYIPSDPILRTPPPAIDGHGIFYDTTLYPYQTTLLSDICKAFSNEIYLRFMDDFNTVLDTNGLIVNNYWRQADEITTEIDFESLLDQTEVKFISNKATLKSSLETVLDKVFAGEEIHIINLGDYSDYSIGGALISGNINDIDYSIFNDIWFDIDGFNLVTPKITNNIGISLMASLNVDIKHRTQTRFEFRLFDSVAQQELDRCVVQTINYDPTEEVGYFQRDYIETYPIQLQYFGPVSQIKCQEEVYNKCLSETDMNIMSHIAINAEDVFSDSKVDDKFSFITNRIGNMETSSGNTKGGVTSGIIDIETPRIYRVQWRMVIDAAIVENGHKSILSDMTFNNNTIRGDLFEISANLYSLGEVVKKKVLSQGVVQFNNDSKKRISLPLLSSSSATSYSITLACSKNINVWYENKTASGFVIAAEKEFEGQVTWIVNKQPELTFDNQDDLQTIPGCLVDFIPEFTNKSNFQIFSENGYNINLLQETIPQSDIQVEQDNQDLESIDQPDELTQNYYEDPNGHSCGEECINDCPDDWFCSDLCPNADLTKSGCACCECITSDNCPDGYTCIDGECVESN